MLNSRHINHRKIILSVEQLQSLEQNYIDMHDNPQTLNADKGRIIYQFLGSDENSQYILGYN